MVGAADAEVEDAGVPKEKVGLACDAEAPATEGAGGSAGFAGGPKLKGLAAGLDPRIPPRGWAGAGEGAAVAAVVAGFPKLKAAP